MPTHFAKISISGGIPSCTTASDATTGCSSNAWSTTPTSLEMTSSVSTSAFFQQSCLGSSYRYILTGTSGANVACGPGWYSTGVVTVGGAYIPGTLACAPCTSALMSGPLVGDNCKYCPLGTSTDSRSDSYCWICVPGYYGSSLTSGSSDNTGCTICPANFYNAAASTAGSATTCTACPNSGYSYPGATSSSDCSSTCLGGYYLPSGSTTCTACPTGYHSAGGIVTSCTVCAAGYYDSGNGGTVTCTACPAGKYSEAGATSCSSCSSIQPGTWSAAGSAYCPLVAPGYYGTSSSTSLSEALYTGLSPSSVRVLPTTTICESGYYQSNPDQTSCEPCPNNAWSSSDTTTRYCIECPVGYYGPALTNTDAAPATAHNDCTPCPANFYLDSTTTSSITGHTCSACPLHKYSVEGSSTCSSDCPAGYITPTSSNGLTSCRACPAGTHSEAGASVCQSCAAGYYGAEAIGSSTANCTACPAGTATGPFGATTVERCFACVKGTNTTAAGSAFCTTCAPGYFGLVSVVSPYNQTMTASCSPCLTGKYSTVGSIACLDCPSNSTVLSSQGGCKCTAKNAVFANGQCSCATSYTLVNGNCLSNSSAAVSGVTYGIFTLLAAFLLFAHH